jgi:predicted MFS family arabinose efflux permease
VSRRGDRVAVLAVGLALGAWIGNHAHDRLRDLSVLELAVGAALLLACALIVAVAGPPRARP